MENSAKTSNFPWMSAVIMILFGVVQAVFPFTNSSLTNFCADYNCGMGTCKNTSEFPFVKCECKNGWRKSFLNSSYDFLPCILPNCTLNYTCADLSSPAPSPIQSGYLNITRDIFDPCSWAICGGGTCEKKSSANYSCKCKNGYRNFMNWTYGYCVTDCEFEADCSAAGIGSPASGIGSPASPLAAHEARSPATVLDASFSEGLASMWLGSRLCLLLAAFFWICVFISL